MFILLLLRKGNLQVKESNWSSENVSIGEILYSYSESRMKLSLSER